METKTNKFFGQNVTQIESFRDDEHVEYAYHVGTEIAVFRQTDLDSGRHVTLIKFHIGDFENAAKKKYTEFYDFVSDISAVTITQSRGDFFVSKYLPNYSN